MIFVVGVVVVGLLVARAHQQALMQQAQNAANQPKPIVTNQLTAANTPDNGGAALGTGLAIAGAAVPIVLKVVGTAAGGTAIGGTAVGGSATGGTVGGTASATGITEGVTAPSFEIVGSSAGISAADALAAGGLGVGVSVFGAAFEIFAIAYIVLAPLIWSLISEAKGKAAYFRQLLDSMNPNVTADSLGPVGKNLYQYEVGALSGNMSDTKNFDWVADSRMDWHGGLSGIVGIGQRPVLHTDVAKTVDRKVLLALRKESITFLRVLGQIYAGVDDRWFPGTSAKPGWLDSALMSGSSETVFKQLQLLDGSTPGTVSTGTNSLASSTRDNLAAATIKMSEVDSVSIKPDRLHRASLMALVYFMSHVVSNDGLVWLDSDTKYSETLYDQVMKYAGFGATILKEGNRWRLPYSGWGSVDPNNIPCDVLIYPWWARTKEHPWLQYDVVQTGLTGGHR